MSPDLAFVRRGSNPTPREMDCLRAYARTGDYVQAALEVGVSRSTLSNHLVALRRRLGVDSTVQAAYLLRDDLAV